MTYRVETRRDDGQGWDLVDAGLSRAEAEGLAARNAPARIWDEDEGGEPRTLVYSD